MTGFRSHFCSRSAPGAHFPRTRCFAAGSPFSGRASMSSSSSVLISVMSVNVMYHKGPRCGMRDTYYWDINVPFAGLMERVSKLGDVEGPHTRWLYGGTDSDPMCGCLVRGTDTVSQLMMQPTDTIHVVNLPPPHSPHLLRSIPLACFLVAPAAMASQPSACHAACKQEPAEDQEPESSEEAPQAPSQQEPRSSEEGPQASSRSLLEGCPWRNRSRSRSPPEESRGNLGAPSRRSPPRQLPSRAPPQHRMRLRSPDRAPSNRMGPPPPCDADNGTTDDEEFHKVMAAARSWSPT